MPDLTNQQPIALEENMCEKPNNQRSLAERLTTMSPDEVAVLLTQHRQIEDRILDRSRLVSDVTVEDVLALEKALANL
jgi:hypothetical protein